MKLLLHNNCRDKISCFYFQKAVNHPLKMPPHIRVSSETRAAINPQEMDDQLQRLRDRLGGGLIPSRAPLRVHQSTSVVSGSFLCEYNDLKDSGAVFRIRSWIWIRVDLSIYGFSSIDFDESMDEGIERDNTWGGGGLPTLPCL
jgi:hypothetical protein